MKKIYTLFILIIVTISVISSSDSFYKQTTVDTINEEQESINNEEQEPTNDDLIIDLDPNPSSITIAKCGGPPHKKTITSPDDMNGIINFINSIDIKDKLDDSYKGWSYYINIDYPDGKTHKIEFLGDKISYDNNFYTTDKIATDNLKDIYTKLDYPEADILDKKR